jgi:SRSO17 transposase
VETPHTLAALPKGRRGRPRSKPLEVRNPVSVREVSGSWPLECWQRVAWRQGAKGLLSSRFAAARVLPSHGYQHGGPKEGIQWLLAEWPEAEEAPTKFWLSNLPADTDLLSLVRLAKIRWWIEQGYQQLKDELGLDHYEGHTWQGWYHHVTMTMLAFGFLTLEALYRKKLLDSAGRSRKCAVNSSVCWPCGPEPVLGAAVARDHCVWRHRTPNVVVLAGC